MGCGRWNFELSVQNVYAFKASTTNAPHNAVFLLRKQTAETLLSLSPAETANLKEGINFFRNKTTGKEYILYKEKNHLKACKNLCKHQGGLFIKDIEDLDGRYHGAFALLPGTLFAVRFETCSYRHFKRPNKQIASRKLSSCFLGTVF